MTEDKMARQHHQLDGLNSERNPGVGNGQGDQVHYSPWGRKEPDKTERPNPTKRDHESF